LTIRSTALQPFLDTGNEMTNGIVLSVLSAVAQQERITLSERTKAGLQRAKRAGRKLGRKAVEVDLVKVEGYKAEGLGLRAIAAKLGISVNTLQKARGKGWGVRLHQPHSRPLPSRA
jgi:DNA invertase Pin-like site-specific DNA recombinase